MKKSWFTYLILMSLVVIIAIAGGLWGKRKDAQVGERCEVDKNPIRPLYEVRAFLTDQSFKKFCSIPCAQIWQRENQDKIVYVTVVDEKTGQSFDSSLAFFVESEITPVPEVKSRIHTFLNKRDALAHAQQFRGKLIENPLGAQFIPTIKTPLERVKVGALPCLDLLPFHLAILRPIFRENQLDVEALSFSNEKERDEALVEGKVDAIVTDLPSGILLNRGGKRFTVVRTVMRTNPRRPMYALMTSSKDIMNLIQVKGKSIAISKDLNSGFIAEKLLQGEGLKPEELRWIIKDDMESVLKSLFKEEVNVALFREPFVTYSTKRGAKILSDDAMKALGISVILFSNEFMNRHPESVKKFLFGYEQAVLALNFQPDRYRTLLAEKGGLPGEIKDKYPMPILEGANAPSESEVAPVVEWLIKKNFIPKPISYKELVTLNFLPNPENVGLAFCCR
jgi:NitT/TauT family transport system substrate-binding protein